MAEQQQKEQVPRWDTVESNNSKKKKQKTKQTNGR